MSAVALALAYLLWGAILTAVVGGFLWICWQAFTADKIEVRYCNRPGCKIHGNEGAST